MIAILGIAFVLAIIAGIIYGFLWLVNQINHYCFDKYGYEPVTWGKAFWVLIMSTALLISFVANNNGETAPFVFLLLASGAIAFFIFFRIASKTSIPMATLSAGILVIAATLIVFWIALEVMGSDNRRRSYTD